MDQVGVVRKYVPGTRVTQTSGGKQSYNIFAQFKDEEPVVHKDKRPRLAGPPSTITSVLCDTSKPNVVVAAEPTADAEPQKLSTRVRQMPGGASSMGSLLSHSEYSAPKAAEPVKQATKEEEEEQDQENVEAAATATAGVTTRRQSKITAGSNIFATQEPVTRSSTRVHQPSGGSSSMQALLRNDSSDATAAAAPKADAFANMKKSNVFRFSPEKAAAPAAPRAGRPDKIGDIMTGKEDPTEVQVKSNRTGKTNISQNMFNLSPEKQGAYLRTYKTNESQHVLNLTPAHKKEKGRRTYRANEQSEAVIAAPPSVPVASANGNNFALPKHEAHNKQMASSIFSETAMQGKRSTRVHYAPGGKSDNPINWNN